MTSDSSARGPLCPNCRESLRGNLRQEQVVPQGGLGAAAAARKLLAGHHQLAVTPWLVRQGRSELTLEHEIGQPSWAGLFTEAEREEAARRLERADRTPPT